MWDVEHMTKEDILSEIQKKAQDYVPEWRFSKDNPDIGTALAMVYAHLFSGTQKRFSSLPYKNQISFFNSLEARLLPAVPSNGYVTFHVVNDEMEGEEIAAGIEVIAPAKVENKETISFQTLDDIYVTPAQPDCMLEVSAKRDFIGELDICDLQKNCVFLYSYRTQNQQVHRMYFEHRDALSISKAGRIAIGFLLREDAVSDSFIKAFADKRQVQFLYSSEHGYVPFQSVEQNGSQLVFIIGKNDPPFVPKEENGYESYWICCEVKQIGSFEKFAFDRLLLSSDCSMMAPDAVYADEAEIKKEEFFPFGERFTDYSEVYFLAEEILKKKGAEITMAFNLDFVRVPLNDELAKSIDWNWIMRKSDFKPDMEYDVTIEQVVWEYFNGKGWTSLFDKDEFGDIFSTKEGTVGQYKKMKFICPKDISPILINAQEGCYIRAKIVKVNNLYKQRGYYITPVMDNVHLQYDYRECPVLLQRVILENNLTKEEVRLGNSEWEKETVPFLGLDEKEEALYLGFDTPLKGGPIKILFDYAERIDRKNKNLLWEYSVGKDSWRELNLVDETENMSRTGLVTIMGSRDFSKRSIYGKEKYWIRIRDLDGINVPKQIPCLIGLYMNTVRVRQLDRVETEYFHMEIYQENMKFPLRNGKIIGSRLWVNETNTLSNEERARLDRENKLFPEYRSESDFMRTWVEWQEVEDFLDSASDDRHYVLDRNEGIIQFGNGRTGKIPPTGRENNIWIEYTVGGGADTNIEPHRIEQLGKYVGFVSGVYNPKQMTGGCDKEKLSNALKRNAAILRHQNMAVTERDFEELAMTASRNIRRVKCFCGYDDKENHKRGAVTLVILLQELQNGKKHFYEVKNEVENYMKDKIYTGVLERNCFYVIAPEFVEVRIRAEVVADNFDDVFRIKKKIQERLVQFLDALTGNFDGTGWEIGILPNNLQIRNAISDIKGLTYIKNVYMSAFLGEGANAAEVDLDMIRRRKYILPISGEHDIVVRTR